MYDSQLRIAASVGNEDRMKLLLEREDTHINMGVNEDGDNPLLIASEMGHCKVVELLQSGRKLE